MTEAGGPEDPESDADDRGAAEGDPIALPVGDTLDLHSFPPREIADLVRTWLDEAHAAGFKELRVIHGRGIGVQREIVRGVLGSDARVASFTDETGNWGATSIRLR